MESNITEYISKCDGKYFSVLKVYINFMPYIFTSIVQILLQLGHLSYYKKFCRNFITFTKKIYHKQDLLVSIPEATKLLLPSSVPAIEPDLTTVSGEIQWMNFHTNCC